jgi:hypothetical protein
MLERSGVLWRGRLLTAPPAGGKQEVVVGARYAVRLCRAGDLAGEPRAAPAHAAVERTV